MRVLFVYPNLYTQMGFNHGLASLSAVPASARATRRGWSISTRTCRRCRRARTCWRWCASGGRALIALLVPDAAVRARRWSWRAGCAPRRAARGLELPPLVVGGIHPTMVPDEVMADGVWDHVGVGECEDALVELVRAHRARRAARRRRQLPVLAAVASRPAAARPRRSERAVGAQSGGRVPRPRHAADARLRPVRHPAHHRPEARLVRAAVLARLPLPLHLLPQPQDRRPLPRRARDAARPASASSASVRRSSLVDEIRQVLARYERHRHVHLRRRPVHAERRARPGRLPGLRRRAASTCPSWSTATSSSSTRASPRPSRRAGCRILKLGIESGSPRVRKEVLQRFMSNEDILDTIAVRPRRTACTPRAS